MITENKKISDYTSYYFRPISVFICANYSDKENFDSIVFKRYNSGCMEITFTDEKENVRKTLFTLSQI